MIWSEFLDLKALLMKVLHQISSDIGKASNSLKTYPRHVVCYTSLSTVFDSLTEDSFKDLTYRYVISDKDLELVKTELENLDNE